MRTRRGQKEPEPTMMGIIMKTSDPYKNGGYIKSQMRAKYQISFCDKNLKPTQTFVFNLLAATNLANEANIGYTLKYYNKVFGLMEPDVFEQIYGHFEITNKELADGGFIVDGIEGDKSIIDLALVFDEPLWMPYLPVADENFRKILDEDAMLLESTPEDEDLY